MQFPNFDCTHFCSKDLREYSPLHAVGGCQNEKAVYQDGPAYQESIEQHECRPGIGARRDGGATEYPAGPGDVAPAARCNGNCKAHRLWAHCVNRL